MYGSPDKFFTTPVHSENFYKNKNFTAIVIIIVIIDHIEELIGRFALNIPMKYDKFKGSRMTSSTDAMGGQVYLIGS